MSELTQEFTDQLYANYQANVKFVALMTGFIKMLF